MFKTNTSAIALMLAVGFSGTAGADSGKVHWGYEGEGDPSVWSELSPDFAACGTGAE